MIPILNLEDIVLQSFLIEMVNVAAHILILDVIHYQLIKAFNPLVQRLCLRVEFLEDF